MALFLSYGDLDASRTFAIPQSLTVVTVADDNGVPRVLRTTVVIAGRVDTGNAGNNATVITALWDAIHQQLQPCGLVMRLGNNLVPTGIVFPAGAGWEIVAETWPEIVNDEVENAVFALTWQLDQSWPVSPPPGTVLARETTWEFTGDDASDVLQNLDLWERLAIEQTDSLTVVGKRLGPVTFALRPDGSVSDVLTSIETHPTYGWIETVGVRTITTAGDWISATEPQTENVTEWVWNEGTTTWDLFENRCAIGFNPFLPVTVGTVDGEHTTTPCM